MAQEQPRRPDQDLDDDLIDPVIKYGDVFTNVSGELASQPVKPGDAALMQSAENTIFGQTVEGGVAATMQSAARMNERAGLVGHRDVSQVAREEGVVVTETNVPGARIYTESVGGQVIGKYMETPQSDDQQQQGAGGGSGGLEDQQQQGAGGGVGQGEDMKGGITIGEALEAAANTRGGDRPIDQADAAAIQAAEVRATGNTNINPGGLAAVAQAAASFNANLVRDEDKIKLKDIVADSTTKLPGDKMATRQDAEGVVTAEVRNTPSLTRHPGGVGAAVTAAARLNEQPDT